MSKFSWRFPRIRSVTVSVTVRRSVKWGLWHLEFFVLRLFSAERFLLAFQRGLSTITQLVFTNGICLAPARFRMKSFFEANSDLVRMLGEREFVVSENAG